MTDRRMGEASRASVRAPACFAEGVFAGDAGDAAFVAPFFAVLEPAGLLARRDAEDPLVPDPPGRRAALERAAVDLPPGP